MTFFVNEIMVKLIINANNSHNNIIVNQAVEREAPIHLKAAYIKTVGLKTLNVKTSKPLRKNISEMSLINGIIKKGDKTIPIII
jgi:hypothetical protein